ncbi:hypothetical protein DFH09DRAFT_1282505 [Mycena vulgaris]|nr:hypothetical protein DFH09DRAFT_1282505 [Mycena vulgaris]
MVRLDPVTHRLPRPDTRPTVRAEADTPLHRGRAITSVELKKETPCPRDSPEILQMSSPSSWNCWSDGNFQCLFSLEELQATSQLATNWVLETIQNRGSAPALTWQKVRDLVVPSPVSRWGLLIHHGSHTHPTFTHSSVHIPDGSLAFIDFTPKYVISSDVGAAASAPQDTVFNISPPASDNGSSASEWEGITDNAVLRGNLTTDITTPSEFG